MQVRLIIMRLQKAEAAAVTLPEALKKSFRVDPWTPVARMRKTRDSCQANPAARVIMVTRD